jgi:tRNA-specific 2-thiouridylase
VVKVLSLFSGSLASRVATRLVERHEEVESVCLLHFRSPFAKESEDLRQLVREEWPGTPLRTQSLKREYQHLIDSTCGDSFNLSRTCLSCRRLLLTRAIRYMHRVGAKFLVTGELPGQHGIGTSVLADMSESLALAGRVLRPLFSSDPMRMPESVSSWAKLPNGRTRHASTIRELFDLASRLGIKLRDPMTSLNRCKLTFPGFGDRVSHLFHETGFTLNELRLLDFPLYYEVCPNTKIVVALDEQEKRELQNLLLPQDLRVYPATPHGPMTLARTHWDDRDELEKEDVIRLAARITATHLGCGPETPIPIYYRFENQNERLLVNVLPFTSCSEIALLDGVEVVPLESPPVLVA